MSSFALVSAGSPIIHDVVTGTTPAVPSPYVWVSCPSTTTQANSSYVGGAIIATPPSVTSKNCYVLKTTIRARMSTLGLESAYNTALAALGSNSSAIFYETTVFNSNSSLIAGLCATVGASVATIMAPDDSASTFFGVPN
jgi:hypothetical protein